MTVPVSKQATVPATAAVSAPVTVPRPRTPNATTLLERRAELERQITNLVIRGYPAAAGLTEGEFRERLAPLSDRLAKPVGIGVPARDATPVRDVVPFALVVPDVVTPDVAITQVELRGRTGFTSMDSDDLARFRPIDLIELPDTTAYLLTDIDTGPDTLHVPPTAAMPKILAADRSPLTVDEALALVTHFPEVLRERNCFSILGSRCGDRRVPAIWLSRGRPRLGWCWEGAPHTWLGSASAGGRVG